MHDLNLDILEETYKLRHNQFINYPSSDYYFKNCKLRIWEYYQIKGWFEFLINNDVKKAKQAFYDAAKTDIYYYQLYPKSGNDLFSFGRTHVLEAALSDSKDVRSEYSQINYQLRKHGRKLVWYTDMVNDGEGHIYCDLINKAMNRDYSELARLINIATNTSLKLKKNQWMNIDLDFFIGILENDNDKIYNAINILCTKKHKSRNRHSSFYKDIVSHPSQGYLKIAWINEIEIEIVNKLVHNDLIPIKPNDLYIDNVKGLINRLNTEEPPKKNR